MNKTTVFQRILSLLLVLVLCTQLVSPAVASVLQGDDGSFTLTDEQGNVIEENWDEVYPYGTFVFGNGQISLKEGEGERTIQIHRLGGTVGKADVTVTVAPVLSQMEDESYSDTLAAGFYDYVLSVEDTLPIAAYQAYGEPDQPLEAKNPAKVLAKETGADSLDADGDKVYGSTLLSLSLEAEAYRWQAKNADGMWTTVGTEKTLDVENDVLERSDIRCIYTLDGAAYCSVSHRGETYRADDPLPEMPADLERNPEKSFTVLDPEAAGIELYGGYEFTVTFAEGESVKELKIISVDDDEAENVELLALRISACRGGSLYDTANTMTVSITDNEVQEPSFFGFETTELTVDKAAGKAVLTVRRSGALQYVTTVDYHTEDGTAVAGEDYAHTEGQLYFPVDVAELTIEIPLIDNHKPVSQEDSDLGFAVVLENPAGGTDSAIVEGRETASVKLYHSGQSDGRNLASMLYTPEADDVSGDTDTTDSIVVSDDTVVEADPVHKDSAEVGFTFGGGDDISALTYEIAADLVFDSSSMSSSSYWSYYADLGGAVEMGYTGANNVQGLAYQGWNINVDRDGAWAGMWRGDIAHSNGDYKQWGKQSFEYFDQWFNRLEAEYKGDTDVSYGFFDTWWSTAHACLTGSTSGSSRDPVSNTHINIMDGQDVTFGPGTDFPASAIYTINAGTKGHVIGLGITDRDGGATGDCGGRLYVVAAARRNVISKPLRYRVYTADDERITASERVDLYNNIAPQITIRAGEGGSYMGNPFVGSTLTLSAPLYSSYQFISTSSGTPISLDSGATYQVNTGTVNSGGSGTLTLISNRSKTFAKNGGLDDSEYFQVNAVLDRVQKIQIDVTKSVPRNASGNMDESQIQQAIDDFKASIQGSIEFGEKTFQGENRTNSEGYQATFQDSIRNTDPADLSANQTMLSYSVPLYNLQYVNFHLPHEDQILFNGVQYAGDEDIPISVGMFGMETLTFVYYDSEFISVESDMTMAIGRVEHYVDYNGNGMIDGYLDDINQFHLTEVDGVADVLVEILDEDQYNITEFAPVFGADGVTPVQHFLKFYYNMTPRCLSVPKGASQTDPAQILPSFVTSVTDATALHALSDEMQGFRFIDSGVYTAETRVYNNSGELVKTHGAGAYSGDGKLMYGAAANAVETVDLPLGGDHSVPIPTYIYMDRDGNKYEDKRTPSEIEEAQKTDPTLSSWFLSDAIFKREDWYTDYRGNLLYEFHDPEGVFIDDGLFGSRLPVADESSAYGSGYDAMQTNLYLGSFNTNDTVALCIRPQTQTTQEIHDRYDLSAVTALDETVESGEYRIAVDSVNPADFKTIPDGSGMRVMTSPDAGSSQGFDTDESSSSMPEFGLDLGVELPSLSLAVTDYVTVIIDGDEVGFSIGVPLASASKEHDYYVDSQNQGKLKSFTQSKASWETGHPVSENIEQGKGILENLKPNGEQWESLKNARNHSMKRDAAGKPVLGPDGKPQYNDKAIQSSGMGFSMAFNVTIMFKYSPVDNTYYFTSAMVFLQFGFEYRYEIRLGVCPIIYAYFVVGFGLEAAGGVINEREVVEATELMLDVNTEDDDTAHNVRTGDWTIRDMEDASGGKILSGTPGDSIEFYSAGDAFNVYFEGKLKIEKEVAPGQWENLGFIKSEGSAPVLIMLDEKVDGPDVADVKVRATVLDSRATVDKFVPIQQVTNNTFFSGLSLTPSAFLEVGAGVGVECLKAEIYFKANVSITMSFVTRENDGATKGTNLRDPSASSVSVLGAAAKVISTDDQISACGDDETEDFSFDNFLMRAGFGVRVVLLLFQFEMDMIQFGIDYDSGMDVDKGGEYDPESGFRENGWKFAWYAFNAMKELDSYSLDAEEGFPGVKITIPANTYNAQQLFGPELAEDVMDEIGALAYNPSNLADNAFQISGYSSSGDAFRLAEGLGSGADYQLLTVGSDNYLLYTISRDPSEIQNAVDANLLVLSRIQNTGASVGLVNPVDAASATPYIRVDDDNTGDLDFSGRVSGDTIQVSWVSYAAATGADEGNAQNLLGAAAHNTVVKTAKFALTDTVFSAPVIMADAADGAYKFMPAISNDGKLTFFARTNNYTTDEKKAANDQAAAYYNASKGEVQTDETGLSTGTGDPTAAFRYQYTTATNDIYGKNTQFLFTCQTADGIVTTGWTPQGWEESGTRLSSVDMVMLDDTTFYLAYTATQTVTSVEGDSYGDSNVHKLYLQKGSIGSDGKVTLEPAKMLRTLVDLNTASGGEAIITSLSNETNASCDGIYRNTGKGLELYEAHEDPYFGKVKFLWGDLGGLTGEEEDFGESLSFAALDNTKSLFLLFEMNGMAYVVPQDSLESITDSELSKGKIIPFFEPNQENSGRGSMDIGTDGDGSIAAVYTSTLPGTTNNAIFVSKYDATTQSFGQGRMLAMNQMQVYEDSISNSWTAEQTEQAYYGKLPGYETDQRGLMNSFTFSDLTVALGLTRKAESAEGAGDGVKQSTLVILTRGTQTELEETDFYGNGKEENTKLITTKYHDDGTMATSTGIYALSFGVGEKNVGEGKILFENPHFVSGAVLRPTVSFKNTGDVPLLGSEADPITVQLCITAGNGTDFGAELFRWTITEPIAVGQTVTTTLDSDDYTVALPSNLSGRKIYFTVSETAWSEEHIGGVENPIVYSSLTAEGGVQRVIESKPELAVEGLKLNTVGVETVGSEQMVKIAVEMTVTNRGAAASKAPYLQFAHQTGRTMEEVQEGDTDYQKPIYAPLDITNSTFEISRQIPIETASLDEDKANGILRLVGPDGADLQPGYERTVVGTILVPKDAYCLATATGSLNLSVSVYDDDTAISSLSADGLLVSAFDNEYVASNNAVYDSLEPITFFSAPKKLTIPLGTTMRLSLRTETTEQNLPVIEVSELNSQAQATGETHMGVLYYNMGTSGTGSDGYLVLSPASQGSGIIRVADKNTNTWVDISYTVTEAGKGVNIFKDNGRFTWYNAKGQPINPETDTSGAWVFQSMVPEWGSGAQMDIPYLGDLSKARMINTAFSFDTLAETIDLYFDGSVHVTFDDEAIPAQDLTASGGKGEGSHATIDLGENPGNQTRRVTVTVTSETAAFDRMDEHFAGNLPMLPDTGGEAPQIYFSRIMPETASLNPAEHPEGVAITVYIVDENGLSQATLDPGTSGAAAANYSSPSGNLRQFDVVVKQNGTFTVSATDTTGTSASRTVMVDWFNSTVTNGDVPLILDKTWVYLNAQNQPITVADDAMLKAGEFAYVDAATMLGGENVAAAVKLEYYHITQTTVTTTYELIQVADGWYLQKTVTTTDVDGNPVGEPQVSRTPATETTPVPAGSTTIQTRGVWQEATPMTIGNGQTLYPVAQNAVYKLTARHNGAYATALFLMDRLNSDLPTLTLRFVPAENTPDSVPTIAYYAEKGKAGKAGLTSLYLGEYPVAQGDDVSFLSGSMPVLYNGTYQMVVTDTAGNTQSATVVVDSIPVQLRSGAIAVQSAADNGSYDGSITVDPTRLMGGTYDRIHANGIHNAYRLALVSADEDYTGEDAGFGAFAAGLDWTTGTEAWENLAPGVYVLYVRDMNDTPVLTQTVREDYLVRELLVRNRNEDEIIRRNQTEDVVIETEDYVAIIPAGTLKAGDSIQELLITVPRDMIITENQTVVRCTTEDGRTFIVPWCMNEKGQILYVVSEAGIYDLINNPKHFNDIYGHWAEKYINFVTSRELLIGIAPNIFAPNQTLNRAMIVTILGRMANVDTAQYPGTSFVDVEENSWYSSYLNWAVENGIIQGYGFGHFGPSDPVTREQMAAILCRFAQYMGEDTTDKGSLEQFSDRDQISRWAEESCAWAVGVGLFQGRGNGIFDPTADATRAEVCALMKRFLEHTVLRMQTECAEVVWIP